MSQKTATEGSQKTLDFIPGSVFLGLAASRLYKQMDAQTWTLFHGSHIRFEDAHPLINKKRALKIPGSWFVEKGKSLSDDIYSVEAFFSKDKLPLKQCREGFVAFEDEKSFSLNSTVKQFAIKSAYDSEKRKSKDSQMYGYQSLAKGSEWCFRISFDEKGETLMNVLTEALLGIQHIGKSRTAEFGQVLISNENFDEYNYRTEPKDYCLLYAESRLMFFDETGQPRIEPEISSLGVTNGIIDWRRSQIRTFQYAPFNAKRQTRDAERIGIEKGSVICIIKEDGFTLNQKIIEDGVGIFKNEGFGKLLVNPSFLDADADGKINLHQKESKMKQKEIDNNKFELDTESQTVLAVLKKMRLRKEQQKLIFKKVNEFVITNSADFEQEKFASQWGNIRTIAMQVSSKNDLITRLFDANEGYLTHGIASDRWKERNRIKNLEKFVSDSDEAIAVESIINLSSEMAKKQGGKK